MTPPKNGDRLLRWWLQLPPSRRFDILLLFYFGLFLWLVGVCFAPEMVAGIGRLPGPWQRLASVSIGSLVWLWNILWQLGYLHDSPTAPNPFWWLPTLARPVATIYFIWLLHRRRFPLEEQWQRFFSWRVERRQEAERLANLKVLQELRRLNPTVPRPATGDTKQEPKPPAVAHTPPARSEQGTTLRPSLGPDPQPVPAQKETNQLVSAAAPSQPVTTPEPLPWHAGAASPALLASVHIPSAAQSDLPPGTEPPPASRGSLLTPASPGLPAAPDQLHLPFSTNGLARPDEGEKPMPADPEEQPPALPLPKPRQPRRQSRLGRGRPRRSPPHGRGHQAF